MLKDAKYTYRTSIRINHHIKHIIEENFREVCRKTGLKLSYGRIARAFWSSLAKNPSLRKKCMELVCRDILKESSENKRNLLCKKKTLKQPRKQ